MMTNSFTETAFSKSDAAAPGWLAAGMRVYAVGDVHGCALRLAALHRQIADDLSRRPVDRPLLIHLGDYIDRGPDSAGVIALLMAGPPLHGVPTVNLRGNHEQMLLDALPDPETDSDADPAAAWHYLSNQGGTTLAGWGIPDTADPRTWAEAMPPGVPEFLAGLPVLHRVGGYVFVHAGLRPGVTLQRQTAVDLLWIREGFLDWPGPLLPDAPTLVAVHGHTPVAELEVRRNRIGVDTGAVTGGDLTCLVLEGARLRLLTS